MVCIKLSLKLRPYRKISQVNISLQELICGTLRVIVKMLLFICADAGGLFEGDLFGDVTAGSGAPGATPGMPGTSAQPQSLQVCIMKLNKFRVDAVA